MAADPSRLYRNARREAVLVVIVWVLALTWTVGYCYLRGYEHEADSWVVRSGWATTRPADAGHVLGFPAWVFVGILVPWLMCSAFTVGCALGMTDDDLGGEAGDGGEAAHGS